MFQNWGFLLGEIWVLLLIAALLGLFCGWLIWGRCEARVKEKYGITGAAAGAGAATGLRSSAGHESVTVDNAGEELRGQDFDYDGDGVIEGKDEGTRPQAYEPPSSGSGDDLKQIKGIGPKLEDLCHSLGVYYFEQIASWGPDEIAWMDANLEGFYGRVSRDDWVGQAKILATGGETEFSKRVDGGDVY